MNLQKLDMLEKSELTSAIAPFLAQKRTLSHIRYTGKALDGFFQSAFKSDAFKGRFTVAKIVPPPSGSAKWITSNINWADDIIYVNDASSRSCVYFVEFAYRAIIAGRLKEEYSDMVVVDVLNSISKELPEVPSYEIKTSNE
jgi:hypothetical protein